MIDRQTVDRIIDAANIYDVVSEYVSLRRSGSGYKGLCPFHDDKTPSFHVNPAKGICKCFACGKGGSAIGFIMEIEQMTYPDALRHLAKKFGIEIKEKELSDEEKKSRGERESMLAINEWAAKFYHDLLLNTPDGKAIGMAYFRSRGFRDDIIEKFCLGYAPDQWDTLSQAAKKKGFKEEYLINTSLVYKNNNGRLTDKFRGRVMFPWFSISGQILAFGGRVLDSRTKGVNQKYINSNDSTIYHKLQELYGLFQAKKQIAKEQMVYMVEGYTDVLSMHQAGIENVVANSGTALNNAQIHLLKRFTNNITLIYDSDEAGIHAAMRGTDMLLAQDMNVKVLTLPEGEDPDSFARAHSAQEFKDYVTANQTDFIIFKVNLLYVNEKNDPRKRSDAITSILQSIALIPSELVRTSYIHECAQLMNVDEEVLMRTYMQIRKQNQDNQLKEAEREKQRQEYLKNRQQGEGQQANGVGTTTETDGQSVTSVSSQDGQPINAGSPPSLSDTPNANATPVSVVITRDKDAQNIMGMETLIMRTVVRYGEKKIPVMDEEDNISEVPVVLFVKQQLELDGMGFVNPLYVNMINDAIGMLEEDGFSCSRFYLTSPDLQTSSFAADMLNDRYRVDSMMKMEPEENTLSTTVPRLILDYKYYIIRKEIRSLKKQLADKDVVTNPQQLSEIMNRYKLLTDVQKRLAKELGDRIVSR